jgi:ketosteroid isomerase-like protein
MTRSQVVSKASAIAAPVIIVMVALGARTVGAPEAAWLVASDSTDVADAVKSYDRALRTGDSAAVLSLLAPDAVILESGSVETREEYRAHHLPADMGFARAVASDDSGISVRVRGDVAWAWSTSVSRGEYRGRAVNTAGAELMVLTRSANGWRIAAIHWSSRQRR